jgi:hypothetical protein
VQAARGGLSEVLYQLCRALALATSTLPLEQLADVARRGIGEELDRGCWERFMAATPPCLLRQCLLLLQLEAACVSDFACAQFPLDITAAVSAVAEQGEEAVSDGRGCHLPPAMPQLDAPVWRNYLSKLTPKTPEKEPDRPDADLGSLVRLALFVGWVAAAFGACRIVAPSSASGTQRTLTQPTSTSLPL